jgi:hypothetical protein
MWALKFTSKSNLNKSVHRMDSSRPSGKNYKRKFSNQIITVIITLFLVLGSMVSIIPFLSPDSLPNAGGSFFETIFFDDMELGGPASMGMWKVLDDVPGFPPPPSNSRWELGTPVPPPNAFSPNNVWGTELSGAYQGMSEAILVTPPIDLSYLDPGSVLSVQLNMMHVYNFAPFDGGWVEINPVQMNFNPVPLEPDTGYPGGVMSWRSMITPGYVDYNAIWEKASFDLSDYIGQIFTIGFHFCGYQADGFARGWYIDDVNVVVERWDSPIIDPDQTGIGLPGETISYPLKITNFNALADFIDLWYVDTLGWTVELLNASTYLPIQNTGGDPRYPDVFLLPNTSEDIIVNITIPPGISGWDVKDLTTIYAELSSDPSKRDSAELLTKTPFPDVGIQSVLQPKFRAAGNPIVINVTLENYGDWKVSFDVEGLLSSMLINPPLLSPSSVQSIVDLDPGEITYLEWTFTPTVNGEYTFTITTLLDIDQVPSNNQSIDTITIVDMLWTDDMEIGGDAQNGLWVTLEQSGNPAPTNWELGVPIFSRGPRTVPSPFNVWGTDLDSAYVEDTDCYLFTPQTAAFDLSAYEEIKLEYTHWLKLQETPLGDYGELVYTTDPDPISIPGISGPVVTYTGKTLDWVRQEIDLSFLSGQPYVRFGWHLMENIGGNKFEPGLWPGWYLDDVAVWANLPRPKLIITEIVDSGGNEYIEVFNAGGVPAYLTDYELTQDRGVTWLSTGSWNTPIIPSGGYGYYDIPAAINELNNQGDIISIVNTTISGLLITDSISYGQKGTVPDPIPGESTARYWDGSEYQSVWARDLSSTIGSQNDAPGEVTTKFVVLNEVLYDPSLQQNAFIEVMYVGSVGEPSVDVNGWLLVVGDSVFPIPPGIYSTVLDSSNPFYIIDANMIPGLFSTISISGDNIYLYTDSGMFVDEVGWNTIHPTDTSMSRVPDGYGVELDGKPYGLMGYDDPSSILAGWVFNRVPTMSYILAGPDSEGRNFPGEYVSINLTIENRQLTGDLIEILNFSDNGWLIEIYDASNSLKILDSDSDGIPDIWLAASGSINITVRVHIPENFPIPDTDNVTIYIQSDTDSFVGDFAYLDIILYPYLQPSKSIAPNSIYVKGTGYGEEAIITLKIKGSGNIIPGIASNAADIVFVVDDTGSMGNDIDQVKADIDYITDRLIENITSVRFGLVTYKDAPDVEYDVPLTFDVNAFKTGVSNLEAMGGGDYPEAVKDALIMARDDSTWRAQPVVRIIILIGDADPHDIPGAIAVADDAYINFGIVTCVMDASDLGLQSFVDIAAAGQGVYEHVGNSEQMADAIITAILYVVPPVNIAGEDINQMDSDFMIQDVLPDYIDYIPNSFSTPPENIFEDGFGRTIIQWNVSRIRIGEVWTVSFSVTSNQLGLVDSNYYSLSRINYTRWENSTKSSLFPKTQVLVKLGEPQPPELFIETVDDLNNPDGQGKNIKLSWIPSSSPRITHYLIYRSENQNGFDFSNPWKRTDSDSDFGVSGLRTTWNDTSSADPSHPSYRQQQYYTIRAVNEAGMVSYTSRTVGKWTKQFPKDKSTFSLPLEPLQIMDSDYYTRDMGADYIKWMNPMTNTWVKHNNGDGPSNNADLLVGTGYELKLPGSINYTFCGMPASTIKWNNGTFLGFDWNSNAKTLSANVDPMTGDVTLYWMRPAGVTVGVDKYYVYYSSTRDGFWGRSGIDYQLLGGGPIFVGTETANHKAAALAGTEYYYMVVPLQSSGLQFGASTYSIGVWTASFSGIYDSMGLPLKLSKDESVDWYCDGISDCVGINYYIYSEQRWGWHSKRMPKDAYDPDIIMADGYQISTSASTKYTYIGI